MLKCFPSGKHLDTICRKTAFFLVIFCICQNVSQWQPLWSMLAFWIVKPLFPANSWWKLRWGGPINSRALCAIWFLPLTEATGKTGSKCSLTCSLSRFPAPIQHTRAHLAPWERRHFSLFNPHYSRGADSIWWVWEPGGLHLHTSVPTYLPFMWLVVLLFCCKSQREWDDCDSGWLDGWMDWYIGHNEWHQQSDKVPHTPLRFHILLNHNHKPQCNLLWYL